MSDAHSVVAELLSRGWVIACGESLTAGLVSSQLAQVPGCSAVLRGGVVAYQRQVKEQVLAVSPQALAAGLVSREVAIALAAGAKQVMGAHVGIGTTGAAGPDPHDGAEPGSAWIAVVLPEGEPWTQELHLEGDRQSIREQVAAAAVALARSALA